jgi:hypothetical protein
MRKSPRGLIAVAATAAALIAGQAAIASAQAVTLISVTPETPTGSASFPFGRGNIWPQMGFVYKNLPAFDLKTGDTIAFDLDVPNDVNIQLQISMAATTVNGGDIPNPFTTVVSNTQLPANPLGNSDLGDYELQFAAQAPFHFEGGGLIMRFSNPGGSYALDTTNPADNVHDVATSSDPSGAFVERFWNDADGLPPYDNSGLTAIGGFRLTLLDAPVATPPVSGTPPVTVAPVPSAAKKKCKKKHKRSATAAKKCKKRR